MDNLDAVVQEKIDNDSDFQNTLASLPDEDKEIALNTKRSEIIKTEFEALSKKAQENEQKFNDQKTRAEKAEELAKKGKPKQDSVDSSITAKDVLILSGAGYTHPEDVETIERWAKFNGISIKDALVDKTLVTVLGTQQEERATALATQSKGGARGVASPSAEAILANAQAGKLSEEDTDKLAAARMAKRMEQLGK